jgi:Domain of unknown function (DUF4034)
MRHLFSASGAVLLVVVLGLPLGSQSGGTPVPRHSVADLAPQEAPQEQTDSPESDSQPARAFRIMVRDLFDREKFDDLDHVAEKNRSQKERFRGGNWKLFAFYQMIEGPGSLTSTDAVWNAHIERLQRWIEFKPGSVTPRVALAQAYLRLAWKARGYGYGNTVAANDWKTFKQRVQQARDTLEQAESLSPKDPQWYRNMQTVALAQEWDRNLEDDLLQRASSLEPGYYYFYNAHANYLLPKWNGKRGEAEAFAQNVADRIGGPEGDFIYVRIALDLNCCKPKQQMPDLSWDRVKQGFAALEQLYGSTNHLLNAIAFMAVRQGDRTFAQQIFARIGDDWDEDVWRSKEKFNISKTSLTLERQAKLKQ